MQTRQNHISQDHEFLEKKIPQPTSDRPEVNMRIAAQPSSFTMRSSSVASLF